MQVSARITLGKMIIGESEGLRLHPVLPQPPRQLVVCDRLALEIVPWRVLDPAQLN